MSRCGVAGGRASEQDPLFRSGDLPRLRAGKAPRFGAGALDAGIRGRPHAPGPWPRTGQGPALPTPAGDKRLDRDGCPPRPIAPGGLLSERRSNAEGDIRRAQAARRPPGVRPRGSPRARVCARPAGRRGDKCKCPAPHPTRAIRARFSPHSTLPHSQSGLLNIGRRRLSELFLYFSISYIFSDNLTTVNLRMTTYACAYAHTYSNFFPRSSELSVDS